MRQSLYTDTDKNFATYFFSKELAGDLLKHLYLVSTLRCDMSTNTKHFASGPAGFFFFMREGTYKL
jgi:hypothetical protein